MALDIETRPESTLRSDSDYDHSDTEPEHEAIARLAYAYWVNRDERDCSAEDDWYCAERELRNRRKPA